MPEFCCELQLTVIGKYDLAELVRWTDLPFAPHPGIVLNFDADDGLDAYEVQDVEYCVPSDVFWISSIRDYTGDEYSCPCNRGDGCCEFDESDWRDRGWEIRSVTPRRDREDAECPTP